MTRIWKSLYKFFISATVAVCAWLGINFVVIPWVYKTFIGGPDSLETDGGVCCAVLFSVWLCVKLGGYVWKRMD